MGPECQPLGTKRAIFGLYFTSDIAFFLITFVELFKLVIVEGCCRMWVQYVMLSYYAVARKIQKGKTWDRVFKHKTWTKLKRCLATTPTWIHLNIYTSHPLLYASFSIHSLTIAGADGSPSSASRYKKRVISCLFFTKWYYFFNPFCWTFQTCYSRGTLYDVGPICHTLILPCSYEKYKKKRIH